MIALVDYGAGNLTSVRKALGAIGAGWALTWRRARRCRIDNACAAPSRLEVGLLGAATLLVVLAMLWQPIIEPWALGLIRNARR